jgi:hypothetical protein
MTLKEEQIVHVRTAAEARAAFGAGSWAGEAAAALIDGRNDAAILRSSCADPPVAAVEPCKHRNLVCGIAEHECSGPPPNLVREALVCCPDCGTYFRNAVFVVVLEDRHIPAVITVHGTRDGADRRIDEHKAIYAGDGYEWSAEHVDRWVRYERTDGDGPNVRIERRELEP